MELLRTPFHSLHVAAGARMVPFAGFDMPVQYQGVNAEHLAVRRSVGLFDVSHMGEVRVRGPEAIRAVSRLVTNDVASTVAGQAQYNCMCNDNGGIVDDLVVYRIADDDVLVCVNAANRAKDFAWMVAHNEFPEGAVFTDEGNDWAQIAIQGRNGLATCQALTDQDLAPLANYRFTRGRFAGVDGCVIARTGYTGEDGFEVFVPAGDAEPVWGRVLEAGAPYGIVPVGLGARDTLRLEVRFPLYGHELDDDTSPLQAGLAWVTKLDKPGGFVGRDAIAARKGKESHRLAGLVVDGTRIAREGMTVLHDGANVGRVTSGTRAPSVEKSVALAYLRADLAKPGTRVTIDVRGKPAEADVVAGPFYKRDHGPEQR
jgi:aminomethyltransferase